QAVISVRLRDRPHQPPLQIVASDHDLGIARVLAERVDQLAHRPVDTACEPFGPRHRGSTLRQYLQIPMRASRIATMPRWSGFKIAPQSARTGSWSAQYGGPTHLVGTSARASISAKWQTEDSNRRTIAMPSLTGA